MKTKKNTKALSIVMAVLVALMMGIFPLFYTNNYINIIQSKRSFFETVGWITIVICCVIVVVCGLEIQILLDIKERLTTGHKVCICFLLCGLFLSTSVSDDIANTVFAPDGRRYGLTVILLCLLSFVLIATYYIWERWIIWVMMACNGFMSIIIIEDNWKNDLLGMKSNLIESQYSKFTGTMGNINVNASYLAIIIPLFVGLFIAADKLKLGKAMQVGLVVCIYLTMSAGLCVRSDSIIWCIFLVSVIVWYYTMVSGNTLEDYLKMAIVNACLVISFTVIGIGYLRDRDASYGFSHLGEAVCTGIGIKIIWGVFIASLLLIILKMIFPKINLKYFAYVGKFLIIACVMVGGIMILLANVLMTDTNIEFIRRFYIDDSFGSNRGYVWRRTIKMIISNGFLDFLCGCGMNRFYVPFYSFCYSEMMAKFSSPFIDAHNEALQMLVTTGVLGMIGYIGMFVTSVAHGMKRLFKSPVYFIEVAVFASYILQGLVNNPQVFTLPIIFIVMGMIRSLESEYEEG